MKINLPKPSTRQNLGLSPIEVLVLLAGYCSISQAGGKSFRSQIIWIAVWPSAGTG